MGVNWAEQQSRVISRSSVIHHEYSLSSPHKKNKITLIFRKKIKKTITRSNLHRIWKPHNDQLTLTGSAQDDTGSNVNTSCEQLRLEPWYLQVVM